MGHRKQKNPKRVRLDEEAHSEKKPTVTWDRYLSRCYYHGYYFVDENGDMQWENGVALPGTPEPWPRVKLVFE